MSLKTINILTLDGGGVRGLSALLILEDLLRRVALLLPDDVITPRDVFDVVAGTSTGGLIAIMLGKLHMSVADCIEQYNIMAKELFGKISIRGWVSRGHWKERYSEEKFENCFRKVAMKYRGEAALKMLSEEGHQDILTTVVAREVHSDGSFKRKAAFICSHPCDPELDCLICEAARATTAAPGYFPIAHIGVPQRFFIDGAFYYNNPSYAVWEHYTDLDMKARLRFINIGTGSAPETSDKNSSLPRKLGRRARKRLTSMRNLFKAIKQSITDTEHAFSLLRTIARKNDKLDVYRFSCQNDLHKVKLDAYKRLDEIQRCTRDYLQVPQVQRELDGVAEALAEDFRTRKHAASLVATEAQAAAMPAEAQVAATPAEAPVAAMPAEAPVAATPAEAQAAATPAEAPVAATPAEARAAATLTEAQAAATPTEAQAAATPADTADIILEDARVLPPRTSKDLDRLATQGLHLGTSSPPDLTGTTTVPTDEPPEKSASVGEPRSASLVVKEFPRPLEQDNSSLAGLGIV